jgi:type IV pilus assembly protein PilM
VLDSFGLFSSNSNVLLRPRLACEITPDGVIAARQGETPDLPPVTSFAPLPAGSLAPGLTTPNLPNRDRVVAALKSALDEVAERSRNLTLVIPDVAVRVLLLDFDTLPSKAAEALPIIRFRLRKLVSFDVEDAAISWQVMEQSSDQVRTVVAVMPKAVQSEYESAVREAGYEPGAVLPSTLCAIAVVPDSENALIINCNGISVTSAITRQSELMLHRTLDLPPEQSVYVPEMQQVVSVAMAYFEDTLATTPHALLYVGPGGAGELERILNDQTIRVRDLVPSLATGAANAMPKGLLAGVIGALAN